MTVTINGSNTTPASAKAIMIGPAGEILTIVVTDPGSGYLADGTTTVSITPNTGSPTIVALADAIVNPTSGEVIGINVTEPGAGYMVKANTGIRKFLDTLPWAAPVDPASSALPAATKQVLTETDGSQSDYYEIGLVQYRQKMHTDLAGPGTLLRGYVQLKACGAGGVPLANAMLVGPDIPIVGYCGATQPTYLGAAIIADKNTPVRITFRNLLPIGSGGDLFIPTDVTVMGAGMGPNLAGTVEMDQTKPMCGADSKPAGCFTENRATLHLHGGITPWISDGTPHQWITPAGERAYPEGTGKKNVGVSTTNVPDMWYNNGVFQPLCTGAATCAGATNDPGDGAQTFYYTNQQSARLLFYHDHAWGITRLNVYAGEAAAYLIKDQTEADLHKTGGALADANAGLADLGVGIPLVIQDKTFVPSPEQLAVSDETWDTDKWGGKGNLWLPHVYSPAQNPGDTSGVNQYGRWAYGPWFWPPTQNIIYQPVDNPYYCDINGFKADGVTPCEVYATPCDPNAGWCEPPMMPGTPWNSMGMEAFHDTPIVNGVAYPKVELPAAEYRFRILNAASDRFLNLHFYQAVDANGVVCDAVNTAPVAESTGVACTEVRLNAAEVRPRWQTRRSSRPQICRRRARAGSRSAPKAASCPPRLSSRLSPSPGWLTPRCSTPATWTCTRCCLDPPSARMWSWT